MQRPTRRRFVQAMAGVGILSTAGTGTAFAQPVNGTGTVLVRREINSLSDDDLSALRAGVAAMMARDPGDPTSWSFQAKIHGTHDDIPDAFADVWATCQHGTFFFLSWHRMYIHFFDRILRAAAGPGHPDFALPYWNYSVPAQRALPIAFRTPATSGNPLFTSRRRASRNAGAPLPVSATVDTEARATINFVSPRGSGRSFGGQEADGPIHQTGPHGRLESQPHDVIHVAIGGQNGWMSDPDTAALDPIFWLHHCNIDRLWEHWRALAGGRSNPTADETWMNTAFTFYDESGNKVTLTGADVLDTQGQLDYRYDDLPANVAAASGPETTGAAPVTTAETSRVLASRPPSEGAIGLTPRETTLKLQPASPGATESAAAPGTGPVVLSFGDISYRRPVGVYYEIYLNKPADAPPDPSGPYYAGNLAIFGLGHAHRTEGVTGGQVALDVTGVLSRQRERGLWSGGEIKIDLHPAEVEPGESTQVGPLASIGEVQLLGR
jgi:Common central domain of tyrosinase/Polyphenol oxidase middle domain